MHGCCGGEGHGNGDLVGAVSRRAALTAAGSAVLGAGLLSASTGIAAAQPAARETAMACAFPEIVISWSQPPASLATVRERNSTDVAGRVNQPYRVQMTPCAATWCKPDGRAAMVKIDIPRAGRWRVEIGRASCRERVSSPV